MSIRVPLPIVFAVILALGLLLNLPRMARERAEANRRAALGLR